MSHIIKNEQWNIHSSVVFLKILAHFSKGILKRNIGVKSSNNTMKTQYSFIGKVISGRFEYKLRICWKQPVIFISNSFLGSFFLFMCTEWSFHSCRNEMVYGIEWSRRSELIHSGQSAMNHFIVIGLDWTISLSLKWNDNSDYSM